MSDTQEPTQSFLKEVDSDALKVVRRLLTAGHEAYLVGGCVRDLYLRRRPKDFDIATSATPEAIRRLFRNSRIIGRRFKLAHVFFGPKIIETSTFRTAPTAVSDDDPLITHDNEWGSVEDDARRRDFTINGLFYDVDDRRIVDFVDGVDDLDAGIVRTIGDPVTRFREDPVRMIRAIKFAARLKFTIEPATWDALVKIAPDIVKCSRARVLEEMYKVLRGGNSAPALELMLEGGLLQQIMPQYLELYDGDEPGSGSDQIVEARHTTRSSADEDADVEEPAESFWWYLEALDEYIRETSQVVSNGVLQACLFAPLLTDGVDSLSRRALDSHIETMMNPIGAALGVARRDRELARQILMAHRRMVFGNRRRKRVSMAQRQYFHDALVFLGLTVKATGRGGSELARWQDLVGKIEPDPPRKRRRRKKRSTRRKSPDEQPAASDSTAPGEP